MNIFRVTVRGRADMANARYISGFYDQRAVDLFFNETRATALPSDQSAGAVESIFPTIPCPNMTPAECATERERRLQTVPIGSNAGEQGAFVMILSTSADAIANTIGAFAENDLVVGSAMYLATQSDRGQAAAINARSAVVTNIRAATMTELSSLLTGTAAASDPTSREAVYLQMLNATAAGLMPQRPPRFATVQQARDWFAARPWEDHR